MLLYSLWLTLSLLRRRACSVWVTTLTSRSQISRLHQMNLLLDTHSFICSMKSSERITKRESIEGAGGVRVLCVASAWERAIEASRSARTRLGTH